MTYILLKNCRELLTVEENAKDLIGLKKNTSLLIENERIKKIGTYKELKKEDPEAGINNAIVSYCIDSTSEQYKKQINQLYKEITRQIKQNSDLNEVNYDLKGLETFQKAWIRYRNSKCALVDPGLGEHYCLMSENRMRVEKLKKIKAGEEAFYSDEDFE